MGCTMLLYLVFGLIFWLSLLIIPKINARSKLIFTFLTVLEWILFAGSTGSPDYYNYSSMYYGREATYKSSEVLYYLVSDLFKGMGFSYVAFNAVLIGASLLALCHAASLLVGEKPIFLLMYLVWPGLIDWVQVRNMLAMALLTWAVACLITDTKRGKLKFVILIAIAAGFQIIAIAYFPIVMLQDIMPKYKHNKKSKRMFLLGIAALAVLSAVPQSVFLSIARMVTAIGSSFDGRLSYYLNSTVKYGYLMNWAIQIANYIFARWAKKIADKRQMNKNLTSYKVIELMECINLYMFVFFPLYRLNTNFLRLTRNLIPLMYLDLIALNGTYRLKVREMKMEQFMFTAAFIFYVAMVMVVQLIVPHWNDVVMPLINERLF